MCVSVGQVEEPARPPAPAMNEGQACEARAAPQRQPSPWWQTRHTTPGLPTHCTVVVNGGRGSDGAARVCLLSGSLHVLLSFCFLICLALFLSLIPTRPEAPRARPPRSTGHWSQAHLPCLLAGSAALNTASATAWFDRGVALRTILAVVVVVVTPPRVPPCPGSPRSVPPRPAPRPDTLCT
ncbi:hypothetical protein E2C01_032731 [Portunus trituberculatus]|uniref:Uncharacterized protein n=1 Tax=Portunus trituberculatus TaxID=210409 RepID=A0A5B7F3N9_PORTR|nr:hypothetical protein [Portunus trituberculatus]